MNKVLVNKKRLNKSWLNRTRLKKNRLRRSALYLLSAILFLGTCLPSAIAHAQYVRVAPPPPVVERPYGAPGAAYRWIPGYHRWDGHRYIWTSGRWVVPPRPRAMWVPGHWEQSPYGWRWASGYWRG